MPLSLFTPGLALSIVAVLLFSRTVVLLFVFVFLGFLLAATAVLFLALAVFTAFGLFFILFAVVIVLFLGFALLGVLVLFLEFELDTNALVPIILLNCSFAALPVFAAKVKSLVFSAASETWVDLSSRFFDSELRSSAFCFTISCSLFKSLGM